MTLRLSPEMQAQLEAHAAKSGMSVDAYLEALLRKEMVPEPASPTSGAPQFQKERGIWVFRTGQPMPLPLAQDALEAIRTEREARFLGNTHQ